MSWFDAASKSDTPTEDSHSGPPSASLPWEDDDNFRRTTECLGRAIRGFYPTDDFKRVLKDYLGIVDGANYWSHWDKEMDETLGLPSPSAQRPWSLGYILWSPYSPVQLERQPRLSNINWRDAFEELISATEGKEISCSPITPLADVFGWICRVGMRSESRDWEAGVMGPVGVLLSKCPVTTCAGGILSVEELEKIREWEEESHEDCGVRFPTELDLYRRPFGDDKESSKPSKFSAREAESVTTAVQQSFVSESYAASRTEDGHGERPSVVATLTTTESVTDVDGKVHTKVVLKKRFADGREESSETVYSGQTQEGSRAWSSAFGDSFGQEKEGFRPESRLETKVAEILSKGEHSTEEAKKKKSSWFWS